MKEEKCEVYVESGALSNLFWVGISDGITCGGIAGLQGLFSESKELILMQWA